MSNFLIFKAAFNNSATPAIGTYTAEGATALFNLNAYLYNNADDTAVQWFVPTAETTDFEFVADILTRQWTNRVTYFIIADSTGATRLRMWSRYNNWFFENSDSDATSGTEYIGVIDPTTSGGFGVFHQFRVRVRKLTASSSSVEVYVDGTLKLTATAGAALVTCAKIGFVGGVNTFGPGTGAGVKNAYVYDLSGGEVIDRGVLSGAFNRFISWMKSKFALKSDIPTVNDATLTIQKNGTNVATFTANQSTAATANITVPTKTSDLTNDSGFITSDNTKIPLAGSNAISGSLIPATTDAYDLGSSSYQWNNLYAKSYYYNGTQWGLDQANVWTGRQTYDAYLKSFGEARTDEWSSNSRTNAYLLSRRDTADVSGFLISTFRANLEQGTAVHIYGWDILENSIRYSGLRFTIGWDSALNSGNGAYKVTLGTNTQGTNPCNDLHITQLKTINGINPGALSLPSSTYINVDTTNWVLDGSNVNSFTPTSDGWLGIQVTDTVYDQMHYVFVGRTDGGNTYYQQNVLSPINALWDGEYHGCVFIPVVKNSNYDIRCICSTIIAKFYPCQGNV